MNENCQKYNNLHYLIQDIEDLINAKETLPEKQAIYDRAIDALLEVFEFLEGEE